MGGRRGWLWLLIVAVTIAGGAVLVSRGCERPRYISVRDAVEAGDLEDVRYHAAQGADLFEFDNAGYSLLHTAALNGRGKIAQFLITQGLNPDVRDPELTVSSYTALHLAARENRFEVARVLADAGADVNARDARGRTPLHLAAMSDADRAARILLEHRADPNLRDDENMTPLGLAVKWEKKRVGRVLVQYGAVR